MSSPNEDQAPAEEVPDLLEHSTAALKQRAAHLANATNLVAVSNALTLQWLDMNRKFFDRANRRLEVASEDIAGSEEAEGSSVSYFERSEKFQSVTMSNAKDYFQQFERFSLGASILMQRMAERYGKDLAEGFARKDN